MQDFRYVLCRKSMELAYVAGLFDGEGCVQIQGPPERIDFRLTVSNTHKPVLDLLKEQFGGFVCTNGVSSTPVVYQWRIGANKALVFAKAILPHTQIKREQLSHFIAMREGLRRANSTSPLTSEDLTQRQQAIDTLKRLRTPA